MKKKSNNHQIILYVLVIIAIAISIFALAAITTSVDEIKWRCSFAECTQYTEISGEEWARENCAITAEGTICLATLEDGRQIQVPLEELDIRAITVPKCLEYVCVEEAPYKEVNYVIDIEDYLQ